MPPAKHGTFGELLPLVARELHLCAMPTIRSAGLTPAQFWMLKSIQVQGPLTPSTLAKQFGVRAPSITTLLNGLEGRGLVARVRTPTDRRVVKVNVSAKGERLLAKVGRQVASAAADAAEGAAASDMAAATRVLQTMAASLKIRPNPTKRKEA